MADQVTAAGQTGAAGADGGLLAAGAAWGPLLRAAGRRRAEVAELLGRAAVPGALDDADLVHDVRVAVRRLEEVARLLRGGMDKAAARAVGESLKAVRRAMGALRDADVTREHLDRWRMPAAVKAAARALAEELAAGRPRLAAAAGEAAAAASVQGSLVVLARVVEERAHDAEKAEAALRAAVAGQRAKREKGFRKAVGKAALKQTADALHAARVAAKKLRYVTELAEEAGLGEGLKKRVKFLKRVQELLGDHHDVHVIAEMLEARVGGRAGDGAGRGGGRPPRGLAAGWRGWRAATGRAQAKRAAAFFALGYEWVNAPPGGGA
jgi:CHAD domain-containing protein